jgi:hypothetical protein
MSAVEPGFPARRGKTPATEKRRNVRQPWKLSTPVRAARCRPPRQAGMPDATVAADIHVCRGAGFPSPAEKTPATEKRWNVRQPWKPSTPVRAAGCRPPRQAGMPDATVAADIHVCRGAGLPSPAGKNSRHGKASERSPALEAFHASPGGRMPPSTSGPDARRYERCAFRGSPAKG